MHVAICFDCKESSSGYYTNHNIAIAVTHEFVTAMTTEGSTTVKVTTFTTIDQFFSRSYYQDIPVPNLYLLKLKLNSMALVRERTIPTVFIIL
jgi:hypothetical protein